MIRCRFTQSLHCSLAQNRITSYSAIPRHSISDRHYRAIVGAALNCIEKAHGAHRVVGRGTVGSRLSTDDRDNWNWSITPPYRAQSYPRSHRRVIRTCAFLCLWIE